MFATVGRPPEISIEFSQYEPNAIGASYDGVLHSAPTGHLEHSSPGFALPNKMFASHFQESNLMVNKHSEGQLDLHRLAWANALTTGQPRIM